MPSMTEPRQRTIESRRIGSLTLAELLKHRFDALVTRLHRELADAGFPDIRPAHSGVLEHIEPSGSRLTEIAQRAGVTKPTVLAAIDDLQRLGYAERVSDPRDGRAKLVRLTPRGTAAAAERSRIVDAIEAEWNKRPDGQRAQNLRRALEELHGTV